MQNVNPADLADEKMMYRVGGISALVFGIAYIICFALHILVGAPPIGTGVEAWLVYMAENTTLWWVIIDLFVLTDFLLVPIALALYLALKPISRNAILLATAYFGLFIVLDLAITWTNYATLNTLGGNYAATTDNAQRAALVMAAIYPSTVVESNILFVYNTLTLSAGILMTSLVMLKGIFSKITAYVGVVTGILGIVSVVSSFFTSALDMTIIIASVLTTVWILFVGHELYRLG